MRGELNAPEVPGKLNAPEIRGENKAPEVVGSLRRPRCADSSGAQGAGGSRDVPVSRIPTAAISLSPCYKWRSWAKIANRMRALWALKSRTQRASEDAQLAI